jgi:hypothetical protein
MSPSDGLGFRGIRHGQLAVIPNIGHVISSGKIEASQLPDPASRHRRVRAVAEGRQRKNPIPNMINIAGGPADAEGDLIIGR